MMLERGWRFEKALEEASKEYYPGGVSTGPQRNRTIEAWGQLVGRTRAIREFDQAIAKLGSKAAFAREYQISSSTLRTLREFYQKLPIPYGLDLAPGDVLGSWTLVKALGSGGSAEVWKASSSRRNAAIKVLRKNKGRMLERFRAEIDVLRALGNSPGILPMIDYNLPKTIAPDERIWLVLPVATLVREITEIGSPRDTIFGVCQIADTMTLLHARRIFHRDLKPDNLYRWRGQWVVSDFGIASFPGKANLTTGSTKLGPLHYIAPEMIAKPTTAEGAPADVYSLAKILWVLLVGERFPPPGEQRVDIEPLLLEKWVKFPRINKLNDVIEECTYYSPGDRLRMARFAEKLRSWLADDSKAGL